MTPEKISCGICRDLLPLVLDGVAGRMRGYALPRPGYPPG